MTYAVARNSLSTGERAVLLHEATSASLRRRRAAADSSVLDNEIRFHWRIIVADRPTPFVQESTRRHQPADTGPLKRKASLGRPFATLGIAHSACGSTKWEDRRLLGS